MDRLFFISDDGKTIVRATRRTPTTNKKTSVSVLSTGEPIILLCCIIHHEAQTRQQQPCPSTARASFTYLRSLTLTKGIAYH
jgi:hypothetical protein